MNTYYHAPQTGMPRKGMATGERKRITYALGCGKNLVLTAGQLNYVVNEPTARKVAAVPWVAAQLANITPVEARAELRNSGILEFTPGELRSHANNLWRLVLNFAAYYAE